MVTVKRMLVGKHSWRTELSVSSSVASRWSQLNDVFSIHFSVVILIAGKFRRTVDVVHGTRMHAAATGATYAEREPAPPDDPTPPTAYCRHYNRSDYRSHVGKFCLSLAITANKI